MRREVARSGGSLELSVLQERMAELYGRAPDRVQLQAFAAELGFVVQGEAMVRPAATPDLPSLAPITAAPDLATPPPTTAPSMDLNAAAGPPSTSLPPPSARATRGLQGIPAELKETIDPSATA